LIICIFAGLGCNKKSSHGNLADAGLAVQNLSAEPKMLYAVLFEDSANLGAEVRRQHMSAHLSFLEKNAARIKAAGPLRAFSGDPAGGLWIVEADGSDAVDELVKEDPFWRTGLRRSVRILSWSQVFADGKRLI
jgi:uncharacterized protein YciI